MASIISDKPKQRNATGAEILDNLLGAKGIKTDLSVNIEPATIWKALAIVGGSVALIIGGILIYKKVKK